MASQANLASTRLRPAWPMAWARAGSWRRVVMPAARVAGELLGVGGKGGGGVGVEGDEEAGFGFGAASCFTVGCGLSGGGGRDDDLEDAAYGGGDHWGFAGHGFEVDDAEGLVNGGAAEDGAVAVELDGFGLGDHLLDPDDVVAAAGGVAGGEGVASVRRVVLDDGVLAAGGFAGAGLRPFRAFRRRFRGCRGRRRRARPGCRGAGSGWRRRGG